MHVDNKGKDILILGEELTQGLDDAILTAEVKYAINFTQLGKRFLLSLHYNWSKFFICSCYKPISIQSKKFRNKRLCTVFW